MAAKRPLADVPNLGSFSSWAATIGGILAYAGIKGFLDNLPQFYMETDETANEWAAFLAKWYELYSDAPLLVADLTRDLRSGHSTALSELLPGKLADELSKTDTSFQWRLGKALSRHLEVRFGPYRLARHDISHKATQWKVIKE